MDMNQKYFYGVQELAGSIVCGSLTYLQELEDWRANTQADHIRHVCKVSFQSSPLYN